MVLVWLRQWKDPLVEDDGDGDDDFDHDDQDDYDDSDVDDDDNDDDDDNHHVIKNSIKVRIDLPCRQIFNWLCIVVLRQFI